MAFETPSLTTLPLELFFHLVTISDTNVEVRHKSLFYDQPADNGLEALIHPAPLKALSQTCKAFHAIIRPLLFRNLRLKSRHIGATDINLLVNCIQSNYHESRAWTLLACISTDEEAEIGAQTIVSIYKQVEIPRLIIVAPPAQLAKMTDLEIPIHHDWVFQIPYQVLCLDHSAQDFCAPARNVSKALLPIRLRTWETLLYNEGSSTKAYSTYEFHNFQAPSLFANIRFDQKLARAREMSHLHTCTYVAVFPFNFGFLRFFIDFAPRITKLRIQFAPSQTDSRSRSLACSSPGTSASDFWAELRNAYLTLRELLHPEVEWLDKISLQTIVILDYSIPAYREIVESAFCGEQPVQDWEHDGAGTWNKTTRLSSSIRTATL